MPTTIRDVRTADLSACLEINNAAVPNVNPLSADRIEVFASEADYFRVAEREGRIAGFLIALLPDHEYASPNFQWFRQNYEQFVYIDRVVVARDYRGLGIGNVFYADVQSYAEQRAPFLTCEVNLTPRNDVSLLFHGARGFHEVGQQSTDNGDKRVSLLAKPLPSYDFVRSRCRADIEPVPDAR